MEIKTSADIVRIALSDDDITSGVMCFLDENKKWVTVDDMIKCIDDTYADLDMGKTIPIFIQRLKEKLCSQSNEKMEEDKIE